MPLPGFLTNILGNGGKSLLDGVSNLVKDFKVTPEQQQAINAEVNRHLEVMSAQAQKAEEIYLADVQNARQMQIEALKQGDNFSKRFVYFLAAGMILLTMGYDFCFFWVKFPAENKDLLNMVAGVLNTSCLVMIVSFFFGSSKSSEDKQKQIEKMINT